VPQGNLGFTRVGFATPLLQGREAVTVDGFVWNSSVEQMPMRGASSPDYVRTVNISIHRRMILRKALYTMAVEAWEAKRGAWWRWSRI
jgi:hypothetical protein